MPLLRDVGVSTVVSYSDPSAGHTGSLYRACNWIWAPTWLRLRPPPGLDLGMVAGSKHLGHVEPTILRRPSIAGRAQDPVVVGIGAGRFVVSQGARQQPHHRIQHAERRGLTAWHAAGAIHSDIQRGFVRAEVISAEALVEAGGYAGARDRGVLRLEGRDYLMKDGDVLTVKHTG